MRVLTAVTSSIESAGAFDRKARQEIQQQKREDYEAERVKGLHGHEKIAHAARPQVRGHDAVKKFLGSTMHPGTHPASQRSNSIYGGKDGNAKTVYHKHTNSGHKVVFMHRVKVSEQDDTHTYHIGEHTSHDLNHAIQKAHANIKIAATKEPKTDGDGKTVSKTITHKHATRGEPKTQASIGTDDMRILTSAATVEETASDNVTEATQFEPREENAAATNSSKARHRARFEVTSVGKTLLKHGFKYGGHSDGGMASWTKGGLTVHHSVNKGKHEIHISHKNMGKFGTGKHIRVGSAYLRAREQYETHRKAHEAKRKAQASLEGDGSFDSAVANTGGQEAIAFTETAAPKFGKKWSDHAAVKDVLHHMSNAGKHLVGYNRATAAHKEAVRKGDHKEAARQASLIERHYGWNKNHLSTARKLNQDKQKIAASADVEVLASSHAVNIDKLHQAMSKHFAPLTRHHTEQQAANHQQDMGHVLATLGFHHVDTKLARSKPNAANKRTRKTSVWVHPKSGLKVSTHKTKIHSANGVDYQTHYKVDPKAGHKIGAGVEQADLETTAYSVDDAEFAAVLAEVGTVPFVEEAAAGINHKKEADKHYGIAHEAYRKSGGDMKKIEGKSDATWYKHVSAHLTAKGHKTGLAALHKADKHWTTHHESEKAKKKAYNATVKAVKKAAQKPPVSLTKKSSGGPTTVNTLAKKVLPHVNEKDLKSGKHVGHTWLGSNTSESAHGHMTPNAFKHVHEKLLAAGFKQHSEKHGHHAQKSNYTSGSHNHTSRLYVHPKGYIAHTVHRDFAPHGSKEHHFSAEVWKRGSHGSNDAIEKHKKMNKSGHVAAKN